jgi:cytidylate kinase
MIAAVRGLSMAERVSRMIITIDGPAGTGKSTVALAVAERLRFDFLDTGAMYRAVGLECVRRGTDLEDGRGVAFVAKYSRIEFDWVKHPPVVTLNGEPVGHLLRSNEVTKAASKVAVVPAVREMLVKQQRQIGDERKNVVTEGRDQGSVVFPEAALKIYLDASSAERARRRATQLRARGEIVDIQDVLDQIVTRDRRDASRATAPLAVPAGAEVIDTTGISQDEVIDRIVSMATERLAR